MRDVLHKIIFEVPGEPRPWKRPGQHRLPSGKVIRYPDKKVVAAQSDVKLFFIHAAPDNWIPWTGPVIVNINAYFLIPNSKPKWWKELAAGEKVLLIKRPDGDNITKLFLDALQGIAYRNDSQVHGSTYRWYARRARTEVEMLFLEQPTKESTSATD